MACLSESASGRVALNCSCAAIRLCNIKYYICSVAFWRKGHPAPLETYLDLFNGVHYEHVLQVLHSSLHPVVERSRSLGKLQEQLINGLQKFFRPLEGVQVSHISSVTKLRPPPESIL